jgi:hypothetical protein
MVKDSRTAARADQLRPLNRPREIEVQVVDGGPVAIIDGGHHTEIERIQDCWRIDDEWWREAIQRCYYQVALASGRIRTIYHDVQLNTWFEQGY